MWQDLPLYREWDMDTFLKPLNVKKRRKSVLPAVVIFFFCNCSKLTLQGGGEFVRSCLVARESNYE